MLSKTQNKYIRSLTQQKFRNEYKVFIAEGAKIALEWLCSAAQIRMIVATAEFAAMHPAPVSSHPEAELLIVKAKWCGHCKTAMPEFEKLVAASPFKLADGNSVTIRMLDEADHKDEIAKLPVKGFPTILFRNGATPVEYSGPRTYEGVMGFLKGI